MCSECRNTSPENKQRTGPTKVWAKDLCENFLFCCPERWLLALVLMIWCFETPPDNRALELCLLRLIVPSYLTQI